MPDRPGQEADRQVGARALEVDGVEPALVERGACPRAARSIRSFHAATGSSASRRQTRAISLPQLLERLVRLEVGVHELRPARASGRARSSSCCGLVHVLDATPCAPGGRSRPMRAGSMPSRSPGSVGPAERDRRSVVHAVLAHHLDDPLRLVAERVLDPVLEPRPLDVGIAVDDVHVHRPRLVGPLDDGAGQLLLAERGHNITRCPGWTLAPNPTASSAILSSVAESTAAIYPPLRYSGPMRTHTLARGSALAGLAAASATVAHGGTAALATPAWSAARAGRRASPAPRRSCG